MSLQSCPPGSPIYIARRDITVETLPGAPTAAFNCGLLPTRADLQTRLVFRRVAVVGCYTDSVMGYLSVHSGGSLAFDG